MISKYIELVYYEMVIDRILWVLTNCFLFYLNRVTMFIWQCRGHRYQLFQRRSSSPKRMTMKNASQKLTDIVNFIQGTWFVVFRTSIQQSNGDYDNMMFCSYMDVIYCVLDEAKVQWMFLSFSVKSWGFVLRQ